MKFNRSNYEKNRPLIIEKIKAIHDWEHTEGFYIDGIINPATYEQQPLRILVILAESYGYDKQQFNDIEEQEDQDILGITKGSVKTPRKISTLLWLIFTSIKQKRLLSRKELPKLLENSPDNQLVHQKTIAKIAYLNIKKASKPIKGNTRFETSMDFHEIYNNGIKNLEIIQDQIRDICPDLIIACSNPVIEFLYDYNLLSPDKKISDKKGAVQTNEFGQKIIFLNHPNFLQDWSYDKIFSTYEMIFNKVLLDKKIL